MGSRHHRHPIFCILPPYILRSIQNNGTEEQRRRAAATQAIDNTFRAVRLNLAASTPLELRRRRLAGLTSVKQRTIFTANNAQTLPGSVARAEGAPPSGDVAVDEAYDGLGHTFDFFLEAYNRNSIDDEGLPLGATVHYGESYNNAFWNGERMVFGDGDGELFNRFTIALDVIAHELGHGITEDETGLAYLFQPGALNEHLSDVWGALVKQWFLNQTADEADWLIGAELLGPNVKGQALRSMKEPGTAFDDPVLGKDIQPGHMDHYVDTWEDNGGVHINSGIPNRAFYHAAMAIGGYAWEKTGRIWYEAIRSGRIRDRTNFEEFANITVDIALRTPGCGAAEQNAVAEAWAAVGILRRPVAAAAPALVRVPPAKPARVAARTFGAERRRRA